MINLKNNLFPQNSRYWNIDTAKMKLADGREVAYLKRRFLPKADQLALLQEHTVEEGDRLDNITFRYWNDPLQFWRICDANNAMNPTKLTEEIGRRLRITLPEGVPGLDNAAA